MNARDIDGSTALHVARSSAVARTLIQHGAKVDERNGRGMTPLHRVRGVGVARVLLEHGALVGAVDFNGNTPLHLTNDVEVVKILLKFSASISTRNLKGETPIHTSFYVSKVLALAKAGADLDAVDRLGRTLLMKKSRCFYMNNLLRTLLELNPSIFLKDANGRTAADYALNDVVKEALIRYRFDQNWRRRKLLILLREKSDTFVARTRLVAEAASLPGGLFRTVVSYL